MRFAGKHPILAQPTTRRSFAPPLLRIIPPGSFIQSTACEFSGNRTGRLRGARTHWKGTEAWCSVRCFASGIWVVPSIEALSRKEADDIHTSRGTSLVNEFWGRYVAFLHDAQAGESVCLRDPSGALTAFHWFSGVVDVVFSHPEELSKLRGCDWKIDWQYVARRLVHNRLQNAATGVVKVRQVNAGERLIITRQSRPYELCWDPRRIATTDPIHDARQAAQELREVTLSCVSSWSSCYKKIVHRLSGGLDSSIVGACLATTHGAADLVNLNLVTPTAEGDERQYAAKMAEHMRRPLLTFRRDPACVHLEQAAKLTLGVVRPCG